MGAELAFCLVPEPVHLLQRGFLRTASLFFEALFDVAEAALEQMDRLWMGAELAFCLVPEPVHLLQRGFLLFFNDTAATEIYTLSLHDALPIWLWRVQEEVEGLEVAAAVDAAVTARLPRQS